MITVVMGQPGIGKSTLSVVIAKKYQKKGIDVYCKHHMLNTYKLDINDLGRKNVDYACLIMDEAELDFCNRRFKSFKPEWEQFFAEHRHSHLDIYLFAQNWEDLDLKLRRLAQDIWLMEWTFLKPWLIKYKKIAIRVGVNEEETEIVTKYKIRFMPHYHFKKPTWAYFDSYEKVVHPMNMPKILWGEYIPLTKKEKIQMLKTDLINLPNVIKYQIKKKFKKH